MNAPFSKYEAYFGRGADFVLEARAGTTPAVSVGRFPAVSTGFLRRATNCITRNNSKQPPPTA
jgi:hypothetical protein